MYTFSLARRPEACGAVRAVLWSVWWEGEMAQFSGPAAQYWIGWCSSSRCPTVLELGQSTLQDWASHLALGGFFDEVNVSYVDS